MKMKMAAKWRINLSIRKWQWRNGIDKWQWREMNVAKAIINGNIEMAIDGIENIEKYRRKLAINGINNGLSAK
jgi:hypothetical protein